MKAMKKLIGSVDILHVALDSIFSPRLSYFLRHPRRLVLYHHIVNLNRQVRPNQGLQQFVPELAIRITQLIPMASALSL
jgi:hypothetical protein